MIDLSYLGITNVNRSFHNLSTPALYEQAVRRREGLLCHLGPLVTRTGHYTGRSANDKFIVEEASSREHVWWGEHNKAMDESHFERLKIRLQAYLQGRDVFVQDCYAGADEGYRVKVRVITETAWHNLFARNMFIREFDREVLARFNPDFTMIHCPNFQAIPEYDSTHSEAFILVHFGQRLIIIGGTSYGGEIKKSIFTVMNYILPRKNVLGMHCSANRGPEGDVALFFGLSGTGKTTLSSESDRALIGDDEHGWSDRGIFNFEGGCYAKVIRLSAEAEPEIYETTRRFGTILENVAMNTSTRRIDLDDDTLTENTRAAYPITHLPNIVRDGIGTHPKNIIMLTADAFGVMPPVARMSPAQAMYHFISGYTAKIAGTERGITEPKATFSACFGAPFMALHPTVYANLLGQLIERHKVSCWLVNTGWTGGPYGVGSRIQIRYSRAVIKAALSGALDHVAFRPDPVFNVSVPEVCPGVPTELLTPKNNWKNPEGFDRKAAELAGRFARNFAGFEGLVSESVKKEAPVV